MIFVPVIMLFMTWMIGFGLFVVFTLGTQPSIAAQKADGMIVLTGGRGRIDTAFDLLLQGHGEKLLISGVHQQTDLDDILNSSEHLSEEQKNTLRHHCCITLGYNAGNTYGNATEAANWAEKEAVQRIRLITSDYHILRARVEFQRQIPHKDIIMHPVRPERSTSIDADLLKIMHNEYNKFIVISALYFKERLLNSVLSYKESALNFIINIQSYISSKTS
jgi:uncharacterized SAM-binding protein YcdF (DUF218 family)